MSELPPQPNQEALVPNPGLAPVDLGLEVENNQADRAAEELESFRNQQKLAERGVMSAPQTSEGNLTRGAYVDLSKETTKKPNDQKLQPPVLIPGLPIEGGQPTEQDTNPGTESGPTIAQEQRERLLGQLKGEEITPEERRAINERFAGLVDVVVSWAGSHEHDVDKITPLGGGFKNPVLMVTTVRGEQFVAKGFTEAEGLSTTKEAQSTLGELFAEDEQLIPKSEIFNDTLFSEKAEGSPVKSLISEAVADPEQTGRALEAFRAVGATLGMIHERTERPVQSSEDLNEDVVGQVVTDRDKIMRHLDDLTVDKLVDIDPKDLEAIKERVIEFTEPKFVSLVHGDAHLDQFFHETGGATVEIVDYDDIREGDPMADLARVVASQRDWCREYGASRELEMELTRAVVNGYESTRRESDLIPGERELDVMRVVAYELRLHLVKLKGYSDLRDKLGTVGAGLGLTESELIGASAGHDEVLAEHLSAEEQEQLKSLRAVAGELKDILEYLRPVDSEESPKDDPAFELAA